METFALTRSRRVETEVDRQKALAVLVATYQREKGWVRDAHAMFPSADLGRREISWFLATKRGEPVGVLRVLYDPPVDQYLAYGLQPVGDMADVVQSIGRGGIAEIGRFAVAPGRRSGIGVVLSLMRIATREIVRSGYTQLVTDVFENDPHSPLGFHTRVVGFQRIATHEAGELLHKGRRITLLLDIRLAYQRLRRRGDRFFRAVTRGWTEAMHQSLAL